MVKKTTRTRNLRLVTKETATNRRGVDIPTDVATELFFNVLIDMYPDSDTWPTIPKSINLAICNLIRTHYPDVDSYFEDMAEAKFLKRA
jgi:hypothetical protein